MNEQKYEKLVEFDLKNKKVENIITYCYKLDTNEMPNNFRLLDISQIIPEYDKNVLFYRK